MNALFALIVKGAEINSFNKILPPLLDLRTLQLQDFWFEAVVVALITAYLLIFISGGAANKNIVRRWLQYNSSVWESEFAVVGHEGHKLIKDGPRDYIYFSTGRKHVVDCYILFRLIARHDFIQWVLDILSNFDPCDKVTIDVTLPDSESDDICFAILLRKRLAGVLKERWDLDNFPKAREMTGFPKEDYVLLTDCPEVTDVIWRSQVVKKALWESLGFDEEGKGERLEIPIIESIILTNTCKTKPEKLEDLRKPKVLTFVFRIPRDFIDGDQKMVDYQVFLNKFVMEVIDIIGENGNLSSDGKLRSKKLRENATKFIVKQEEVVRKKELADKKFAAEKQKKDAIVNLPPAAQRKAEEKIRKKELKKSLAKRTKK